MAAYILTVSPPLSARWRHVASFPLPSAQACPIKIVKEMTKEMTNGMTNERHEKSFLLHFRRCHKGRRGEKQGFLDLGAQPLSLRCPLLFPFSPLPEFPLRRLAPRILLSRGQYPPPHIRGGEEVEYRPAASLVRQQVSDLPAALSPPGFLPDLLPERLLLPSSRRPP